jgi:hypothetical protein
MEKREGSNSSVEIHILSDGTKVALRSSPSTFRDIEVKYTNFMGAIGVGPLCYCYSKVTETDQTHMLLRGLDFNLHEYVYNDGEVIPSVGHDVVSLIASTCDAGYVNVDIKDLNVMIDSGNRVYIIDWDPRYTKLVSDVFDDSKGMPDDMTIRVFLSVTMLGLLCFHLEAINNDRSTLRLEAIIKTLRAALEASKVGYMSVRPKIRSSFGNLVRERFWNYFQRDMTIDRFFSQLEQWGLKSDGIPTFNGVGYADDRKSACCTSGRRMIFTRSFDEALKVEDRASIDDVDFQLPPLVSGVIGGAKSLESLHDYVLPYSVPFVRRGRYLHPTSIGYAKVQQASMSSVAKDTLRRTPSPGALFFRPVGQTSPASTDSSS